MRILIAEDEIDTAIQYKIALEERNHEVILAIDGEACTRIYKEGLRQIYKRAGDAGHGNTSPSAFDVVVLDYRMPKVNGMSVAREILSLNPQQRIIFASAYVKETLLDSIKQLRHVVELIQKPFELDTLINMIEDETSYKKLQELNEYLKELNEFDLTQEQVKDLLESIERLR
ncbi:MAG: response regulator [Candidatus Nitrosocaldus sp.]|nr:response regulator [Candidatus Nitrosocaldus sp.]MDW8275885.1 response regulator [Candidatus Nitrosocaldus sp.]